jgi:KAP-like P-loop domain-containing protein
VLAPDASADPQGAVPAAQEAAVNGIVAVLAGHLVHDAAASHTGGPHVILVDGRFRSQLVARLARRLRDKPPSAGPDQPPEPWAVARFDAWQYQRLAPPWWWLITTVDRELQAARSRGRRTWHRLHDYAWRGGHFLKDVAPVLVLLGVAVLAWWELGQPNMSTSAKWLNVVVGGSSAAIAVAWSGLNVVRRLMLGTPVNAAATLRTKDPMERLRERYRFLIRSAKRPVIVVVDNLDRCDADYVVDLLEGIHTLLKPHLELDADDQFVAFVVPADRTWLSDSFMQRYAAFRESVTEPGRPFGLSFVDKVFDVMLCLPRISPACAREPEPVAEDVQTDLENTTQELDVRRIVCSAEQQMADAAGRSITPVSRLRVDAVVQLGKIEATDSYLHTCSDTRKMLGKLSRTVDVGDVLMHQLRDAYCVHRTEQLLGGYEIDVGDAALLRLGLWTVLDFRWPLLTALLRERPQALEDLQRGTPPDDAPAALHPLFRQGSDPHEIAQRLTVRAVRQFTRPLTPSLRGEQHDADPALTSVA